MKNNLVISILSVLLLTVSTVSLSAPMPPSPDLASSRPGLFTSALGFEIDAADTEWLLSEPPKDSKYIVTMYKAPKKDGTVQPSLTVRVDNLKTKYTLDRYVKKWMKEYPKFGFDVLGSKGFNIKGQNGYVIDLIHQEQKKQMRQVVFLREQNAVVFTCRDEVPYFKNTLKSCNSIIRSFHWTQPVEATKKS